MQTSEKDTATRSGVLLGASGLVGGHLLSLLKNSPAYGAVTLLTRRPLGLGGGKVCEALVEFERSESFREYLAVDDVFCCLGTTMNKAGSREAFRRVDFDAPLAVARAAQERGAKRFVLVTAVGANPTSRVFYSRVKGETEAAVGALDFPQGVKIVRPSMLLGERSESRPAERAAMRLMSAMQSLFVGGLTRYRPISASDVARAMLRAASLGASAGRVHIYQGADLFDLAR